MVSVEQVVRNVLEAAIQEGLVAPASENWTDADPQRRSSGELVGVANLLSSQLRNADDVEAVHREALRDQFAIAAEAMMLQRSKVNGG